MALTAKFDGRTYVEERDGERLTGQWLAVFNLMEDGRWRTLKDIADVTGDPEQSISARLRDFRKPKFGGHTVERSYISGGLWEYRLAVRG